jgi:hypothetical protein
LGDVRFPEVGVGAGNVVGIEGNTSHWRSACPVLTSESIVRDISVSTVRPISILWAVLTLLVIRLLSFSTI